MCERLLYLPYLSDVVTNFHEKLREGGMDEAGVVLGVGRGLLELRRGEGYWFGISIPV